MIMKAGANGNVSAYNYSTENNPQQNKDDSSDFSAHGGYPYMNLVEGNVLQFAHSSDCFGPAGPLQTFFRNRVEGKGIIISLESHFPVVVANLLTKGGIYLEDATVGAMILANEMKNPNLPQKVIYEEQRCWRVKDFARPDLEIPASLYASEKPAFLDDIQWPCFGPDVEPENVELPAEKRFRETFNHWPDSAVGRDVRD